MLLKLALTVACAVALTCAATGHFEDPVATQPAGHQPSSPNRSSRCGFLYQTLEFQGESFAYCIYVPPAYDAAQSWPIILALHGSGERGEDGFLQTDVGIGRALRRHHEWVPAIVVMPQCRPGMAWSGPMAQMALRTVEETSRRYRVDPARFYITGLSLGGAGTFEIGAMVADKVAALAPICGFGSPELGGELADIPMWAFHGALDEHVPVEATRALIRAIEAAGGHPKYTEYPEGSHFIWDRVYGNREFWQWLLAQRRDRSTPGAAGQPRDPAGGTGDGGGA